MSPPAPPPLPFPSADLPGAAATSPLSPEQFAEIQNAQLRAKKIRRAVVVATADAWCSSIFAGLTLLSAIFSPISLLLGAGLSLTAFNSFRGLRLFKRMDLRAPKILALNQIALAIMIILYALYSLWSASHGTNDLAEASRIDPALKDMLDDYKPLMWQISLGIYGGLIVATIAAQGLTALFYHSRKKFLVAYLRDTPPWIIELQKKQAGP